ncbi:MAG: hypothetical protein QGG73_07405, partial [Candidatus Hydrogenedentes bacterium]|nr:hypothetical protein [Candidatus Hydrogenedentota bacterium]
MSFAELQDDDETDTAAAGPSNEGLSFDTLQEDLGDAAVATPEAPFADNAEGSGDNALKGQLADFDFRQPLLTASSGNTPPHYKNLAGLLFVGLVMLLAIDALPPLR